MKRLSVFVAILAVLCLVGGNAWAGDRDHPRQAAKTGEKSPGCSKAKAIGCSKSTEAKPGCAHGVSTKTGGTKAAGAKGCCAKPCDPARCASKPGCGESLAHCVPVMTYRIGDKETRCPKEAEQLAGDSGKILYLVQGKTYEDRGEALKALTAALDEFTSELLAVRMMVGEKTFQCPMSAEQKAKATDSKVQYVVLRRSFDSGDRAKAAVTQAKKVIDKISMSWLVDGKPVTCGKTAAKCAKQGKKVECRIGDKTTPCKVEAGMLLARAKLMALIEMIEGPKTEEVKKAVSL